MADENKVAEATQNVASEATLPTFDDVLKGNKAYQSEFDKRIAKALETSKAKWEQEAIAKQNEAERRTEENPQRERRGHSKTKRIRAEERGPENSNRKKHGLQFA